MLDEITLTSPNDILSTELVDYNAKLPKPLSLDVPADKDGFNFFLLFVPLNIVLTDRTRMVRLDLRRDTRPKKSTKKPVVAYCLFPNDGRLPISPRPYNFLTLKEISFSNQNDHREGVSQPR